jgi:hypothetical protein
MVYHAKQMLGVVLLAIGAVTAPPAEADTEIRRPLPGTNAPD